MGFLGSTTWLQCDCRLRKGFCVGLWILVTSVTLSGCSSNQDEVEHAIKERLTDPDSLRVKDLNFNSEGTDACAYWNSKNAYGGYTSFTYAFLSKDSSGLWKIRDLRMDGSECVYRVKWSDDKLKEMLMWAGWNDQFDESKKSHFKFIYTQVSTMPYSKKLMYAEGIHKEMED